MTDEGTLGHHGRGTMDMTTGHHGHDHGAPKFIL